MICPSISPVALCFSPATSIKCPGGSLNTTSTAAAAALPTTVASQGKLLRWTPSSTGTLGNARTNVLFEMTALGGGACGTAGGGGACPTGPRVLFDDEFHPCHHDADSPLVRKTLFGSPQQSLVHRLNDSAETAEISIIVLEET
ncbi:protein kinase [Trypanosoma conorhini]|uniref:Protein kinase n=1 Tax=Trypanosoma conorhini TaxID=83891 RepID=A0A3R7KYY4_9TRYP|nr:protein kinase [Trypanosoma conorhini]RNF16208.1 protein kinase [Trypanosoma conorhini]